MGVRRLPIFVFRPERSRLILSDIFDDFMQLVEPFFEIEEFGLVGFGCVEVKAFEGIGTAKSGVKAEIIAHKTQACFAGDVFDHFAQKFIFFPSADVHIDETEYLQWSGGALFDFDDIEDIMEVSQSGIKSVIASRERDNEEVGIEECGRDFLLRKLKIYVEFACQIYENKIFGGIECEELLLYGLGSGG